jgi:3-methyladenine DNA glycosylase/8-oxoguanine DNA glycosylase
MTEKRAGSIGKDYGSSQGSLSVDVMRARTFRSATQIDVGFSARELRHGPGDPTIVFGPGGVARATRTPEGPATIQLTSVDRLEIEARAWGPGAGWALEHAPEIAGVLDEPNEFRPVHPGLRDLQRRMSGMRFTRSLAIVEALVPTIIEQKVTSAEAHRSFRLLVRSFGARAPGPFGLFLPPAPETLASLPYDAFHPFGIERKRAETIRTVCLHAARLEEAARMPARAAYERITSFQGVGRWSAGNVMQQALGDPDAVLVGDFHMPHAVAWFLAGEPRATDERMLDLLEPYRGQRARAMRPRNRLRDIAAI